LLKLNPHISVDCVIFGFDGKNLKVLLIRRAFNDQVTHTESTDYKLPGDFITDEEDLQTAASRVLKELTGLTGIELYQFWVFGAPNRIRNEKDIRWLKETTGMAIERVVTVAYYSLIKIGESQEELVSRNNGLWLRPDEIRELAFDHIEILQIALKTLRNRLQIEPVGFELLPTYFTIRQLQNLYEAIFGRELDNRNFRKKILKAHYLKPTSQKELHVAHKPAQMFTIDKEIYEKAELRVAGFQF
jgi:ADP-ribose pyrophosphatase YjhB (NUDIX family)